MVYYYPLNSGFFSLLNLFSYPFFASLAPQDFEGHSRLQKELLTAAIDMVDAGACETWDEGRLWRWWEKGCVSKMNNIFK